MVLKTGIIGAGKWGIKIINTLARLPFFKITGICDISEPQLLNLKSKIQKEIFYTTDYFELLRKCNLDAIFIATPNETHYQIAKACLLNNVNVFVEKPLALSLEEANDLIVLKEKKRLVLFVGHILLYHPMVWQLKKLLLRNKERLKRTVKISRTNNLAIDNPNSLLWDFGPHEAVLALYLFEQMPTFVRVKKNNGASLEFSLLFDDKLQVKSLWQSADQKKERIVSVATDYGKIIFDDVKKSLHFGEWALKISNPNLLPLVNECRYFYLSIKKSCFLTNEIWNALQVMKILEAGKLSLSKDGVWQRVK